MQKLSKDQQIINSLFDEFGIQNDAIVLFKTRKIRNSRTGKVWENQRILEITNEQGDTIIFPCPPACEGGDPNDFEIV